MSGDLVLIRAQKSRTSGVWDNDDYDVRVGDAQGAVIGRIFKAVSTPRDQPWLWTITALQRRPQTWRGFTATREQAMAEFKMVWTHG